ncbi:MAG: MFS transporter [Streptosporangiaceae bacterium]
MLAAVPLIAGSLLEMPVGLAAGHGRRRARVMLAGGLLFTGTLLGVAAAPSFGWLLAALVLFFPASGAFVGLAQSTLMDAAPGRQVQNMARWNLAGSAGAVSGPLLLAAVLTAGGTWRSCYLLLAGCAAGAWLGWAAVARRSPSRLAAAQPAAAQPPAAGTAGRRAGLTATARQALAALRGSPRAVRWVLLAEVANLLLDVLTGFVALYFTDVVHSSAAQAALAIAVRLGAGLAGDALLVAVSERAGSARVLRVSCAAAVLLYPAFLLAPGFALKLAALGALSVVTAGWYPLLQAGLYESLPGRSDLAVSLSSAASLVGGLGPLAVGLAAQRAGLGWALTGLAVVPVVLLGALPPAGRPRRRNRRAGRSRRRDGRRDGRHSAGRSGGAVGPA